MSNLVSSPCYAFFSTSGIFLSNFYHSAGAFQEILQSDTHIILSSDLKILSGSQNNSLFLNIFLTLSKRGFNVFILMFEALILCTPKLLHSSLLVLMIFERCISFQLELYRFDAFPNFLLFRSCLCTRFFIIYILRTWGTVVEPLCILGYRIFDDLVHTCTCTNMVVCVMIYMSRGRPCWFMCRYCFGDITILATRFVVKED